MTNADFPLPDQIWGKTTRDRFDTRRDAAKKPTATGSDVTNTYAIVSDMRRDVRNCEGADGGNQAVSVARTLLTTEQLVLTSAQTHARSAISVAIESAV